ncbi:unknown [Bacteroides sp. CAG:661]|nr:unknown [Bacteroides sp. CAG:661]
MAHGILPPLHQVDEGFVHHHLAVVARQAAFLQLHAHQVVVVAHAGIEAGGEQAFAVFPCDETAAIPLQRIAIGGGEVFHIGQASEEVVGVVALPCRLEGQVGTHDALRAEAHVLAHDEVVLHHHHAHQAADEGHARKLHEQQGAFPSLLALRVAAEYLRHRDARKEAARQYAPHQQEHAHRGGRHPQAAAFEEVRQLGGGRILHKVAEAPQQEEHDAQRQRHHHQRLQHEHAEDASATGSTALVHTHHLGSSAQRGDGDEGVVQGGNEEDGQAQCQHDGEHAAHVVLLTEGVAQRLHPGAITPAVAFGQVLLGHLLHAGVEVVHIHPRAQAHVLTVGVASVPRIVGLHGRPGGRQGDDGVGPHGGIVGQVGKGAPHGQVAFVVVTDYLSDGFLAAEHSFGQALAQIDDVGLLEVLHRVAAQHLDAHRLEEERVGADFRLVEAVVAIVERPRRQITARAGCGFHFLGETFEDGACQWPHVHGLRLQLLAVHDELAPHLIDAVVVAEARVVTLLVGHAGKEQDAHGKSQTEGDDFEGNAPLPSEQSLDDVMYLSHVYNVFLAVFCLSLCRNRAKSVIPTYMSRKVTRRGACQNEARLF